MFYETMILAAALDAAATTADNGATPYNPRQRGVCDDTWECVEVEETETPEVEAYR